MNRSLTQAFAWILKTARHHVMQGRKVAIPGIFYDHETTCIARPPRRNADKHRGGRTTTIEREKLKIRRHHAVRFRPHHGTSWPVATHINIARPDVASNFALRVLKTVKCGSLKRQGEQHNRTVRTPPPLCSNTPNDGNKRKIGRIRSAGVFGGTNTFSHHSTDWSNMIACSSYLN